MYNKASGLNIFIFKWLCTEIAKVIFGRSKKKKKKVTDDKNTLKWLSGI